MIIRGDFDTALEKTGDIIRVVFATEGESIGPVYYGDIIISNDSNSDLYFAGEDPVVVSTECDDEFDVIIKKTCKIKLVSKIFCGDYFFTADPRGIKVGVYAFRGYKKQASSYTVLFEGYVTPASFDQDFTNIYDEFEINCVDNLSTLEKYNYKNVIESNYSMLKGVADTVSFETILNNIIGTGWDYDNSKGSNTLFSDYGISETLFYGEEFDDVWTQEEVVEAILRYYNLHIIQEGRRYEIFDWEKMKSTNHGTINIVDGVFMDSGVQTSIGDVYNQISITCNLEKIDNLIESPLEDDNLSSLYSNKQIYMQEFISEGEGNSAINAMRSALKYENTSYDAVKIIDWYVQVLENSNWILYDHGTPVKNYYSKNAAGKYHSQHRILKRMRLGTADTPNYGYISPAILALGSVENNGNQLAVPNNTGTVKLSEYLVIGVNGNGINPTSDDIVGARPLMEYIGATSGGVFSPTDDTTTNYLVFTGKLTFTPIQTQTANYSEMVKIANEQDSGHYEYPLMWWTDDDGNVYPWWETDEDGNYILDADGNKIQRREYNEDPEYVYDTGGFKDKYWHKTVPSDNNGDGRYYTRKFIEGGTPDIAWANRSKKTNDYDSEYMNHAWSDYGLQMPTKDKANHLFKYSYTHWADGDWTSLDMFKKLPVLACELIIGNKRLVEYNYQIDGSSTFGWFEIGSEPEVNGNKITFFTIGIDPEHDEYIIGSEYDIASNVTMSMNLDVDKGMAIPIKKSDALSGQVIFRILGPVFSLWNDVVRIHPTWFRHTKWYDNFYSVLAYCESIFIKDFKCQLMNDNSGNSTDYTDTDKDLIYITAEPNTYINKKDGIDFKIITQLTAAECLEKGIKNTTNMNAVINMTTKMPAGSIVNNVTHETAKPEEHYIDYYYREFKDPKIQIRVSVLDGGRPDDSGVGLNNYYTKYTYNPLNRQFFMLGQEKHVKENLTILNLKEI